MTANSNPLGTSGERGHAEPPNIFLDALRGLGAQLRDGRVTDFGDAKTEAEALASVGTVPLLGTTPLRLTGADRLDFLHGQTSNEVRRLTPGEGRAALMLNVRGHALALLHVFRRDDDLFATVEGGAGARVEAQLRAHIIFDQVQIHNLSSTLSTLSVQGEGAAALLKSVFGSDLPTGQAFSQPPFTSAKVLVAPAARSRAGGFDLHVLTRDAAALLSELRRAGAALAGERALEALRIEAGLAGAEFEGGEGVLPQEAGLEYAVSYRKGCYLGQEIMARIEARGKVRRRLVGLKLAAPPVPAARDLMQEGKVVGRLGGVAEHPRLGVIALASVRTELTEGAVLGVGGTTATLTQLPFAGVRLAG